MAGKIRNKTKVVRTQVSLDPQLDNMLTVLAGYGWYGPNKNEVIISILRDFSRNGLTERLQEAKQLQHELVTARKEQQKITEELSLEVQELKSTKIE